jgi:hypothetical protein
VSGKVARPGAFQWFGFEAAHIFPLAYEGHWMQFNYGRWISLPPERGGTINSVQNGILLRNDMHNLFDGYAFSINPEVCIPNLLPLSIMADDYLRTIIRLYASVTLKRILAVNTFIRSSLMILDDQLMSFYGGISGRLFWLI